MMRKPQTMQGVLLYWLVAQQRQAAYSTVSGFVRIPVYSVFSLSPMYLPEVSHMLVFCSHASVLITCLCSDHMRVF